ASTKSSRIVANHNRSCAVNDHLRGLHRTRTQEPARGAQADCRLDRVHLRTNAFASRVCSQMNTVEPAITLRTSCWLLRTRPLKAAEMIVDSATSIVIGDYAAAFCGC